VANIDKEIIKMIVLLLTFTENKLNSEEINRLFYIVDEPDQQFKFETERDSSSVFINGFQNDWPFTQ
jgi:hypothetical protein